MNTNTECTENICSVSPQRGRFTTECKEYEYNDTNSMPSLCGRCTDGYADINTRIKNSEKDSDVLFETSENGQIKFPFSISVVKDSTRNIGADTEVTLDDDVIDSIMTTGCYIPGISRIVFSTNRKNARVILTTIVYFDDGTRSVVMNSPGDSPVVDKDGNVNVQAKEAGIMYALAKRILVGTYRSEYSEESILDSLEEIEKCCDSYSRSEKDYKEFVKNIVSDIRYKDSGFSGILDKLVKFSYDAEEEAYRKAAERAARKEAHMKMLLAAQEKKRKNPALHEVVNNLAEVVMKLEKRIEDLGKKVSENTDSEKCDDCDCGDSCDCCENKCSDTFDSGVYVQEELPFGDEESGEEVKVVVK